MSGLEVLRLIRDTIQTIQAIRKVYHEFKDPEGLPPAFHEVDRQLPLVETILQTVEQHTAANTNDEAYLAIKDTVGQCRQKAGHLEQIFNAVATSEGMSRLEKYKKVVQQQGKKKKVEALAKELMEDIRLLAQNGAAHAATKTQLSQLSEAIEELSQLSPSLPDDDFITQHHSGSGDNVGGSKYEGGQYHGSGTAYFGPVHNYVPLLQEVKQHSLHECLKSLSFRRMRDRENDIGQEADETCTWLLEHNLYTSWLSSSNGLLCVRGKPGSGKSTLLRFASDNGKSSGSPHQGMKPIILSFFCHGRSVDELARTPTGIYRSLLHQLLRQAHGELAEVVAYFQERCNAEGMPGQDWGWYPYELQRLFESSLTKVLTKLDVSLFLDALNECDRRHAIELAETLKKRVERPQSGTSYHLRVCLTLRHFPQILSQDKYQAILMEDENTVDIERFIRTYIPNNYVSTDIGDFIIKRAQGSFIWARLAKDKVLPLLLDDLKVSRIKRAIESLPEDLSTLYGEIIKDARDLSTTAMLMRWVAFSMRPLTTDEFRWALALEPGCVMASLDEYESSEDFITAADVETMIRSRSCGLVEVAETDGVRVVQFIHPTVKDFLLQGGLKTLDETIESVDMIASTSNIHLSQSCICYLKLVLDSCPTLHAKKDKQKFPLLHYAVTSWIAHAKLGDAAEVSHSVIYDLLRENTTDFINWWRNIHQQLEPTRDGILATASGLIHVASRYGLTKLVSHILPDIGENDIEARDGDNQTALMLATKHGHTEVVELLLNTSKVNINAKDQAGRTPLSRAAREGHEGAVLVLVEKEATLTSLGDDFNWTPLSLASAKGHACVAKLILEKDSTAINVRDTVHGRTPLLWAAQNGHDRVVGYLLQINDIDVDAVDKTGRTSLSRAAGAGHTTVVKLLLGTGEVDVNSRDYSGRTSLSWAAGEGHEVILGLLLNSDHVDVNSTDHVGETPLSRAIQNQHELAVALLSKWMDPKSRDASKGDGHLEASDSTSHYVDKDVLDGINPESGTSYEGIETWDPLISLDEGLGFTRLKRNFSTNRNATPISCSPPRPSREDLVEFRTLTFRNLTSIPIELVKFNELIRGREAEMGLSYRRIEPFETDQIPLRSPRRLLRLIFLMEGNCYCVEAPGSSKSSVVKSLDDGEHEMIAMYFKVGFIAIYQTPKLSSWMKSVDDDWPLFALSIPGTHELPEVSKISVSRQPTSITEQLDNGIRLLEIWILEKPDELFQQLDDFLQREPAETILLSIRRDLTSTPESGRQGLLNLKSLFIDTCQSRWWTEPRIPTLGEARGKIVLLRSYIPDKYPERGRSGKGYGICTDTWLVNGSLWNPGAMKYDSKTTLDWKDTVDSVCRHLDLAIDRNTDLAKHNTAYRLYVSFLGAVGFFDFGLWTSETAAKANQAVVKYLSTRHGEVRKDSGEQKFRSNRTGLIVMDWVDWELVICIIGMNAKLKL